MLIRRRTRNLLLVGVSLLSVACGVSGKHYVKLDSHLAAGQCAPAVEYISASQKEYGKNARLLYLLDKGMVLLLCGQYAESAQALDDAEALAEELWTISLSKEISTFLINEYTQAYGGEDFEKAMINIVAAVDYLLMGQPNEALVECRRLDEKLSAYNQKYDRKNVYKEDAFGRYLSGIIYESQGELSDAYIDYRKAYEGYRDYDKYYRTSLPTPLKEDLARLAEKLDFADDLREYRSVFGEISGPTSDEAASKGRLVVIQFDGRSPRKVQDRLHVPTRTGPVTLAFPRFEIVPSGSGGARITAVSLDGNQHRIEPFLAEDVEKIAIKNLDDRKGRVVLKAIARAVAKQTIAREIAKSATKNKSDQMGVQALFNVANLFMEQADTRSWRTLPARIYLSTTFVDPGSYRISATDRKGWQSDLGSVEIEAKKAQVLFLETMY